MSPFQIDLKKLVKINDLHHVLETPIGDVHPYYYDQKLYMFYLKTNGKYSSALLRSNDLSTFEKVEIINNPNNPSNTEYFVLAITNYNELFYTFYGAGTYIGSSKSKDLIHWEKGDINIPINGYQSSRDPFVFFNKDINKYQMIATTYVKHDDAVMDCLISITTSKTEQLDVWEKTSKELIRYKDGYHGEPEVAQFIKFDNRWYLFVSLARRTDHHVGGLTYYIGEENKGILEQDWQTKTEHMLDGEDLCAAQVEVFNNHNLVYGWIPLQHSGNHWGGALSIPREIYVGTEGKLYIKKSPLLNKFSEVKVFEKNNFNEPTKINLKTDKTHINIKNQLSELTVRFEKSKVKLTIDQNELKIMHDEKVFSKTRVEDLTEINLEVIIHEDIIECFLNDKYSLAARIDSRLKDDHLILNEYRQMFKFIELLELE
ncbi:sucrose-6-phosphate hydrolase [Acholeplasma oculi]|uniref:beta-fructofuranosidase n=1 Tax=Acholeplasma oculi TaxID=35623 RepID=A0A061AH16_9MOLU|nr:hypothetical protein [Acholeplasma oculi]CDR30222.1 Glycosyl hydrolase, family 32 [Acholeplasma oculi]SKC43817.1 beta-fructofuranosidase [Acholeplasma oculi]SUT88605.1 sucrose-6-phosphate hydrolase [Acholeplasma oculi]